MMAPTHVFVALLFSSPLMLLSPESALLIFVAAVVGGFFPDFDLFFGTHRKTLHFPTGYLAAVLFFGLITLVYTTPLTLVLASVAIGVSSHVFGDLLGAGLEHEPWKQTSDKGVYNHVRKEWLAPTFLLGHDGSYKDLLVLLVISPVIYRLYTDVPYIQGFVIGIILLSIVYSVTRKVLPTIEEYLYKNTKMGKFLFETFLYDSEAKRPWQSE